jgi:hypothetical protein
MAPWKFSTGPRMLVVTLEALAKEARWASPAWLVTLARPVAGSYTMKNPRFSLKGNMARTSF